MKELLVSEGLILSVFGGIGALFAGILTCVLRSRCSRIKICCMECDREVIPSTELTGIGVNISQPT
mgnify:CR=1 FL=1